MAVMGKVQKKDIEAFIQKGAQKDTPQKDFIFISLRIPGNLFGKLGDSLKKRSRVKRTGWILEAIEEKIDREIDKDG